MVRELADHEVARYAEIIRWPLAEALLAYEQRIRADARRKYEIDYLAWCILAQSGATKRKRPPELPAILKER